MFYDIYDCSIYKVNIVCIVYDIPWISCRWVRDLFCNSATVVWSVEGEKYLKIYSKLNKIPFNVVKIEQMLTIWIKVEKNTFKYGWSWFCTFASFCGVEGDIYV